MRRIGGVAKASKKIKALFFRTASGNEPVRDWLKSEVDDEDRSIIGADIATVEYGWPVGMPTSRPLGAGLHEVRSSLPGNRIARVIFYVDGEEMILLHGFIKKTQKTSKPDLELARSRKKEMES
jgi:phage-related protein